MASQQQDLVFYSDNSLLSTCSPSGDEHTLQVISHREGTDPSWLLNTLLENALLGTANLVNRDLVLKKNNGTLAVYVSFHNSADFVINSCRKQGLDLASSKNFTFVDCFSDLFTKKITKTDNCKQQLASLFADILSKVVLQGLSNCVVFVEGLEILLAATDATSNDILRWVSKLNQACNSLFITINAESPMINMENENPQDPVFKITDFYIKLYHRSSLNVNILPLSTGRAKDITGCLTVSRGSKPTSASIYVVEKEYVYHLSKESTVKLFFR